MLWDDLLKLPGDQYELAMNNGLEEFISSNKKKIESAIKETGRQMSGVISQSQFDEFYNRIQQSIEGLKEIKASISGQIVLTMEEEEAYRVYLEHKALADKLANDFSALKKQLLDYLEKSKMDPEDKQRKIKHVEEVNFKVEMPPFSKEVLGTLEQDILHRFRDARENLGLAIKHSEKEATQTDEALKDENITASANQKVIQKIEVQLLKIENEVIRAGFEKRLAKIGKAKKSRQYFLSELAEDVQKEIRQQELHNRLLLLKSRTDKFEFHQSLSASINEFETNLIKTLDRDHNRVDEVEALEFNFNELILSHKNACLAEAVAKDERTYIKSQLISALKDLNYEVATKTEVVDFETKSDFLLCIPGQENYLNLRFDEKGRVLYNFLIPEDKGNLDLDETAVKLSEMDETCTEFKAMLNDLQAQGLEIDLKHEIPISEKSLIRIPEYQAQKIDSDLISTKQHKKQKKSNTKQKRL